MMCRDSTRFPMGYGIAHYLDGQHVFSHCMGIKRGEHPMPRWMECLFSEWKTIEMNVGQKKVA